LEKDKKISKDDSKGFQDDLQKLTGKLDVYLYINVCVCVCERKLHHQLTHARTHTHTHTHCNEMSRRDDKETRWHAKAKGGRPHEGLTAVSQIKIKRAQEATNVNLDEVPVLVCLDEHIDWHNNADFFSYNKYNCYAPPAPRQKRRRGVEARDISNQQHTNRTLMLVW